MKSRFLLKILVVALVAFTGCSWKYDVTLEKPAEAPTDHDYFDTLSLWTREDRIIDGMDAKLHIFATYRSLEFRRTYVVEYANRYKLDEDSLEALLRTEASSSERFNEFIVSAYTPMRTWNDFDSEDSIWKLYLEYDGGKRLEPLEIEKLDSDSAIIEELFPYHGPWSMAYVVRFPRYGAEGDEQVPGPDTRLLKLVVAGVFGGCELEWEFDGAGSLR